MVSDRVKTLNQLSSETTFLIDWLAQGAKHIHLNCQKLV